MVYARGMDEQGFAGRYHLEIREQPFEAEGNGSWNGRNRWPASWISHPEAEVPCVMAFVLTSIPQSDTPVRIHVAADERYELYLNGLLIGRGSERGDGHNWFFDTYELPFNQATNTLAAKVWCLGDKAPYAQFSLRPSFLLCPDDPRLPLATGKAPWQCKVLNGYEFTHPTAAWGTGHKVIVHGDQFDWDFQVGSGQGWTNPEVVEQALWGEGINDQPEHHLLRPAILKPQMSKAATGIQVRHVMSFDQAETHSIPIRSADNLEAEQAAWQQLLTNNHSLTIPPRTRRRVLLDLNNYVCAYPHLSTSNGRGAKVRIHWQESLFEGEQDKNKGNRDEIEGKYFTTIWTWKDGVGDTFLLDGWPHRQYSSLWWNCGRYVEVVVETASEPLIIHRLLLEETRYPLENESGFTSSDPELADIFNLGYRTLQMCSHETYMDCPWYEQLQYIGDTRLQALVTYVSSSDDRLPRKALEMFDVSRQASGITQSRYPCRVYQYIPPFSLWWICMIHDFALWRGDKAFVQKLMPGARAVLFWFESFRNKDGLIEGPEGWNYVDWVPEWHGGMPKGAERGVSAIINRQYELALRASAELESWLGEPELAGRCLRQAEEVAILIDAHFWDEKRGAFADDVARTSFSEHAQALSILTNALPKERLDRVAHALVTDKDLHRATVYFSHYVFEAYRSIGRTDLIVKGLDLWRGMVKNGLKTVIEHPEPTRSDCHAWGAHPIYHFYCSLVGARPTELGKSDITVRPQAGGLSEITARFPYRDGWVGVKVRGESVTYKAEGVVVRIVKD